MYAVIFKATIDTYDKEYDETSKTLRQLAFDKYKCKDFCAVSEGNEEITISYWDSLDDIKAWRTDPIHQKAQDLAKQSWYKSYTVEVVEIVKKYSNG